MNGKFAGLKILILASALGFSLTAWSAADANSPGAYALRLPLVLSSAGAPLQRLTLPPQVLVALQSPPYNDLRVFNALGQAVPMAMASVSASEPAPVDRQSITLAAYPILGPADTARLEGLTLRVEEQQGRRVVQINAASTAAAAPQKMLGALLDARALTAPVDTLALDVDLPPNQPITFSVQASQDLKTWRPLTEGVLYRAESVTGQSAPVLALGDKSLNLGMADLAGSYLRITWADSAGQRADVTVRGATLTTLRSGLRPRQRVIVRMAPPTLIDSHNLSFSLPFATPLAALKITPKGVNVLIPVRVLGRNDRSQPWQLIASTTVYRLETAGVESVSGSLELTSPSARFQEIRVEADQASPGFGAAPEITLQFEPAQIVFLASGPEPFTLAAGLSQAASAYLPIASLIPGYLPAKENTLPLAQVAAASPESAPLVVSPAASDALPMRRLGLWGVLLSGVLALGAMAWILLRQKQKPSTDK